MREIAFRGKRLDNGKWVESASIRYPRAMRYGGICWLYGWHEKGSGWIRVDLETVGQYTGLKDKNGKWIFEGDIIEWFAQGESEPPDFGYIEYDEQSFAWRVCWQKYDPNFMDGMQQEYISVVGNIHDNPEHLKEVE